MSPTPIPTCGPGEPVTGCCLLQIPNTSEWGVVCASPSVPAAVPALTEWGGLLLGLLLVLVAARRLR